MLETSIFLNANNPTIVGLWDLTTPPQREERQRVRIDGRGENGVMEEDRRVRVPSGPGQYRAVCKLFASYSNTGADEYIATGWLIANDLVVTSGSNLYNWSDKSGFAKYVKVYFGYGGMEAMQIYRYGTSVAMPAEFLKADAVVHDVGFIRLNRLVDDIQPITYSDTPSTETAQLGVVGYPGDLDFGHHQYEDWRTVGIDLARTRTQLQYQIETSPGQSGAPILRRQPDGKIESIGVHVNSGLPGNGSVIGPVGNRFDEYILALNVKDGRTQSPNAKVIPLNSPPVTGFQMVSITPTPVLAVEKQAVGSALSYEAPSHIESHESALEILFGRRQKETRRPNLARGALSRFPEPLRLAAARDMPPPLDLDKAVQNAKDQDDVQTIFFVNLPSQLDGDGKQEQQKTMDSIQTWQSWASTMCEGKVQQQVDAAKLPSDANGQFGRASYRSKVLDYLFRSSSWFARVFEQSMSRHIAVKKSEFHVELLQTAFEGLGVPASAFAAAERVIKSIVDGIVLGSQNNDMQQYWIMITKYNYQEIVQRVQPVIRIISFQVSPEARQYTLNKAAFESVSFDFNYSQYQADFNEDIWRQIRPTIDQHLIDLGKQLVDQKTTDIEIPR
ncbi:hypothetical protein ACJZ2D_004912 [Fusarium nematophilum]